MTGTSPGPSGCAGQAAASLDALVPLDAAGRPGVLPVVAQPPLTSAARNAKAPVTTMVSPAAITQPRTVRNLVHSACTRYQKLSRSGVTGERCGAVLRVVKTPPPPGTRRSGLSVPCRPA